MLSPGFYALERSQVERGVIARPQEIMSVLGFLRALRHGSPIPKEVLVLGLDRMLYQVYRLHGEGEPGKRTVRQAVTTLSRAAYNSQARDRLLKEGPVVILAFEYLDHGERWRAGIRNHHTNQPVELFWLEGFFRRCEVTEMGGESICHSPF